MSTDRTDEQLMSAVATGDRQAFDLLVRRHLPRAYAVARRMVNNTADAEDAAQAAFTKIWVHAKDWQEGRAKFTTWMHRIVVNTCLDMGRRASTTPKGNDAAFDVLEDASPNAEELVIKQDQAEAVQEALGTLTPDQRAAVTLCYFEEHTNPEAAAIMGIHIKALEGLLVRARKTLRQHLQYLKEERHAA